MASPQKSLFLLNGGLYATLAATALTAGASCPAVAATPDENRAAIQADYAQINADFAHRDLPAVMAFFTPDYQDNNVQSDKCLNRDQTDRSYRQQISQIHSMQTKYTVMSYTPVSAGVEIEIRAHTDGTGEKKVLFAKLHGSFTNDLWVRDLWVETPDGWRIKHRITFQNDTHTSPG